MNNNTDTNSGQPQRPSKYVMLSENGGEATGIRPPPYRRNIPRYHKSSHKSGKCCLKCICCCYCFIILLILMLAGFIFYLYTFFQPKIPSYKFERIDVNNFDMQKDFSLYAEFVVTVKAENPNDKIGIVYDKDSIVLVDYDDSTLCSGKLPAFHQGYNNITVLNIVLKGKSEFGSGLQAALMDNRKTNRIPLFIRVKAPVNVVLGNVPLRQFDVFLNCSMVVDNLSPNKTVSILSTKYNVSVAL